MRKFLLLLLLLLIGLCLSAPLVTPLKAIAAPDTSSWTLVFEDNFDADSLDESKYQEYWGEISASWWNGNDAISLENGLARLKIDKQTVSQNGKTYNYTSGGFTQLTAQTYGRWDIRARLPMSIGTQSYISLWRKDFRWPPEIDFAEAIGTRPDENVFSQHYSQNGQVKWDGYTLKNFDSSVFHEYSVIWEPGLITWVVDGKQKYSTTQKFEDFPMVLALGNLVGTCSSFSGCPDSTTQFPSYLDLDYIRIYKRG